MSAPSTDPRDEVVSICQDLIRIPSVNYGDGKGDERDAAEYVAASLAEVGITSELIESAPRRTSVVARIEGSDSSRPGLVLHGHLDVVPADAKDWQFDPFAAEIHENMIWGRGAVDMKNMDAMMLSVVRSWARTGYKPPRDIVLTFFADEEAGGLYGSHFLVDNRPDLFEGCSDAVSEVGGFSVTLPNDKRIYMIQAAEKGIHWLRLIAEGTASHGSLVSTDNAVVHLASAMSAIGTYDWPVRRTKTVDSMLASVAQALGLDYDPDKPEPILAAMGSTGVAAASTLRNTANPSMLEAGYKANVVPGHATGVVDCRYLPGYAEEQLATIQELIGPKVRAETITFDRALEVDFGGPIIEAMLAAIAQADPEGIPVPYALSGGTDNKALAQIGINGYGFAPMKLPPELPFWALFHGVDERVPIDSLVWGTSVLDDFLRRV
jgi:acetylornithine deacetylase/succinyl-diaminopimelate desuccinylase-like protein